MQSGRFLIDLAACGRWIWVTWKRWLCLCGIALSEEGGCFVVSLVVLSRKDCILPWDVAQFVQSSQGRYRVVWSPFSFYGDMSESSRDLLGVVWGCNLARGGWTFCGRWRECEWCICWFMLYNFKSHFTVQIRVNIRMYPQKCDACGCCNANRSKWHSQQPVT